MEQPTNNTSERGRLTRWIFGEEPNTAAATSAAATRELPTSSAEIIDIRNEPPTDLETLTHRMERLETGMRLMADAMKRAYGDLSNAIRTLTFEIRNDQSGPNGDATLQQSVASLNLTIDELLHSMRAFPHVLAAATDELSQRIEAVEERTTGTLGELLGRRNGDSSEPAEAGSPNA
ncbi:MAG TPA: hypothetical protein VHI54_10940 [Actinomycetota bacterium]|nr:hypothetical protein [Actinomycetota bacterium]